jgi:hypothetical protein
LNAREARFKKEENIMSIRRILLSALLVAAGMSVIAYAADLPLDYRILATSRTSTMEAELNDAADSGYRFSKVMGGLTAAGGPEVVIAMVREKAEAVRETRRYKLLAATRTSTMQREMQQAADDGYEYLGQTVFETAFGGPEVVIIMERDRSRNNARPSYRLLATSKTSTMERELTALGEQGYRLMGMTVGKTAVGGDEIISILRKD